MNAEILSVGTELLLGDIVNTNTQYLAKELANLGINLYYQSVVGDNELRLYNALEIAFNRSDIVITTGGLGPTKDDLTKEVAAKYFDLELVLDNDCLNNIKNHFKISNKSMSENNSKQAYIPKTCKVLANNNGTAPGIIIEKNNKILILLPGPPNEMIGMFNDYVKDYLSKLSNQKYISRTLKICGIGESKAEDIIKDILEKQTNPTIAPYAKLGEVHFRITGVATDEKEADKLLNPIIKELYNRFKDNIYGEDDETLVSVIVKRLEELNLTLAVAESCTGGMLTSKLVDYPGISSVLSTGIVSYANAAKINRLNIDEKILETYGAVSHETAKAMAKQVAITSNTDVGISTTGIAGPTGGTKDKPVGLVYIGIYYKGEVYSYEFIFKGNRNDVRKRTVITALDLLRRRIYNID